MFRKSKNNKIIQAILTMDKHEMKSISIPIPWNSILVASWEAA